MAKEIIKQIIVYMVEHRGISLKFIAKEADVSYTGLSKWIGDKYDFTSESIFNLQKFIKEYHFVGSINDVIKMFNLKI